MGILVFNLSKPEVPLLLLLPAGEKNSLTLGRFLLLLFLVLLQTNSEANGESVDRFLSTVYIFYNCTKN